MTREEQAVATYADRYNCAQAVLSVFAEGLGMERDMAMKAACGFGAGMGRLGETCGALTGGILVLGLRYGMTDSVRQEDKARTYEKVQELVMRFSAEHGHTTCRRILGEDISTLEGFALATEKGLTSQVCPRFVSSVVRILEDLI